MRNTNWTIIALVALAAAGLFYFMRQSDFMNPMKKAESAVEDVAMSLDVEGDTSENSFAEDDMTSSSDDESMTTVAEEAE